MTFGIVLLFPWLSRNIFITIGWYFCELFCQIMPWFLMITLSLIFMKSNLLWYQFDRFLDISSNMWRQNRRLTNCEILRSSLWTFFSVKWLILRKSIKYVLNGKGLQTWFERDTKKLLYFKKENKENPSRPLFLVNIE